MRFTYFYKTSDGTRHKGRVDAVSREEAFSLLRQRGIRAIKVVSDCGSKANGEVKFVMRKRLVAASLAAGLLAGAVAAFAWRTVKIDTRSRRMRELDGSAQMILADHRRRMEAANVWVLEDPGCLMTNFGEAGARRAVATGYRELNATRARLRDLFRTIYETLPAEAERTEANRLYTASMDALDIAEARLARAEKGLDFLVAHRDRWKIGTKGVVFENQQLEREFSEFRSGL